MGQNFQLFLKTSVYFIHPLINKYYDINGRANRKEFFYFQLWYFIYSIIVLSFCFMIALILSVKFWMPHVDVESIVMLINTFFHLVILIPNFALSVRRCHDFDKSLLFALLQFIPIINIVIYFMFFLKKGTPTKNKYGDYQK